MTRSGILKITAATALVAATLAAGIAVAHERGEMGGMRGMMDRGAMGMMTDRPGFAELDADGDGRITAEDFEARRAERFAAFDTNGDGQVSRTEFEAEASARAAERAGAIFERLDVDGDGMLSRDVIEMLSRDVIELGGGAMAPRMIDRFDTDGDGAISAEEFEARGSRMSGMRDGMRGRMDGRIDGRMDGRMDGQMGRHDGGRYDN